MGIKEVIERIKKHQAFLITSHTRLEGDALGSELAFCNLVKKLGKKAIIVNEEEVPARYRFLPGEHIAKKIDKQMKSNIKFDCFTVLDCSDLKRCRMVSEMNVNKKPIINIDHHISNVGFGQANWVDPSASSCSEMIYKLYKKLRLSFDRDTAVCLYVGMLTDTGSFRYTNTTAFTHKAVADLLVQKVEVNKIYRNIYENIPFNEFKIFSRVLPNIKLTYFNRIAWAKVHDPLLGNINDGLSIDIAESVLNFARAIEGVDVAVSFKKNAGKKDEILSLIHI